MSDSSFDEILEESERTWGALAFSFVVHNFLGNNKCPATYSLWNRCFKPTKLQGIVC
jgi:hypothetical protein